eukprot:4526603-Pleurochrysis_carterae.AAC.1
MCHSHARVCEEKIEQVIRCGVQLRCSPRPLIVCVWHSCAFASVRAGLTVVHLFKFVSGECNPKLMAGQ